MKRLSVVSLLVIIIAAYIGARVAPPSFVPGTVLHKSEDKHSEPPAPQRIQRYYAVITPLYSKRRDITTQELARMAKSRELVTMEAYIPDLARLLGSDSYIVAGNISKAKLSRERIAVVRVDDIRPGFRVLSVDGKSIWENHEYPLYIKAAQQPSEQKFDRSGIVTMVAVGDIMLSRAVYKKMTHAGYNSPFLSVAGTLSKADVTFGNLETPLSDSFPPAVRGMTFVAPEKAVEGLAMSGFDIMGLANNHSTNFGTKALMDTLDVLKRNNIAYVGGGATEAEAKSYTALNVRGVRFAFLAINGIAGDVAASRDSPGTWRIALTPYGRLNQNEVDEITRVIKAAKCSSDIVIVMPHWGQEYTHDPNPEMRVLAHRLVDAGADVVVGTHPHWVQGIETYKSGFIAYSLGNFVFDQEWSQETKQGLILQAIFYKKRLINVDMLPVKIEDYHKPRILDTNEGGPIIDAVFNSSMGLSGEAVGRP